MHTLDLLLLPSETTPSATSTPTPTIPSTNPSFDFIPLSKVTTCEICNITWIVSNPELVNLTGVGINLEVAGISDNFILSDVTIATNVPILSIRFKWNPVNVLPGQYEIFGRWSDKHGDAVRSQAFEVKTGNTTACLTSSTGASSPSPTPSSNRKSDSDSVVAIILGFLISVLGLVIIGAIVIKPLRDFCRRRRRRGDGTSPQAIEITASRNVDVCTDDPVHPASDSADDHPGNSTKNVAFAFAQPSPFLTRVFPPHAHIPPDSEPSASRDVGAGTLPLTASTTTLSRGTSNVASAFSRPTPLLARIPPITRIPLDSGPSASRDIGAAALPPTASTTTLSRSTNNITPASTREAPFLPPIPIPTSSSDRAATGLHPRT